MLDIDTAIKHCLEVAEKEEQFCVQDDRSCLFQKSHAECAADHRQLAEWLTELKELEAKHWDECRQIAHYDDELKEAKRLLNEAVLAFRIMGEDIDCHFNYLCEKCPLNNNNDWCEWKYQDEALKLIGGSENE